MANATAFTDNQNRLYVITVNTNTMRRARSALGVDLMEIAGGDLLQKICSDPVLLVDVLWLACESQAKQHGVTDEQFGESLTGDAIEAATMALLEALTDFFPTAKRTVLKNAIAKLKAMDSKMIQAAQTLLEGTALDESLDRALGDLSTTVPAALESTQDR